MSIDYTEIGRRIAHRRRELGLKQTEVCEACNLNDKYLSSIERARSIPSLEVLMRICEVLQTTPNSILLGTAANEQEHRNLKREIISHLDSLEEKQLMLACSFLAWLSEQEIK